MKLYQTTILIWSECDTSLVELSALAGAAEHGDAYCSRTDCVLVPEAEKDADWHGTDFFGGAEDEDR
jgi:hypothetical protein